MVRLKQGGVEEFKVVRSPFQFHNGSIKTVMLTVISLGITPFQFHNGSIKTGEVKGRYLDEEGGFNSTMVRLKLFSHISNHLLYLVSIPQWFD